MIPCHTFVGLSIQQSYFTGANWPLELKLQVKGTDQDRDCTLDEVILMLYYILIYFTILNNIMIYYIIINYILYYTRFMLAFSQNNLSLCEGLRPKFGRL